MIKVLVVEDSAVISALLSAIINSEEGMEVIACAKTGLEAISMVEALSPDLITMDIRMPEMDGIAAIKVIMASKPTPIIVISSNIDDELQISFRAIDEGALAVLEKPCGINDAEFSSMQQEIVNTIRCMAEVQLVKRRIIKDANYIEANTRKTVDSNDRLIAIGCSTGGPQVLKQVLSSLPRNFALPIVVTQHISKGFITGMVEWLNTTSELSIKVAEAGEKLNPGTVYFAPDYYHCEVAEQGQSLVIVLAKDDAVNGFIPSVSRLFLSVAKAAPKKALGIILSGMGEDGADGLLAMRQNGCYTVAQDEQSCIVFGMPKAAISINAVNKVMQVKEIEQCLLAI